MNGGLWAVEVKKRTKKAILVYYTIVSRSRVG